MLRDSTEQNHFFLDRLLRIGTSPHTTPTEKNKGKKKWWGEVGFD